MNARDYRGTEGIGAPWSQCHPLLKGQGGGSSERERLPGQKPGLRSGMRPPPSHGPQGALGGSPLTPVMAPLTCGASRGRRGWGGLSWTSTPRGTEAGKAGARAWGGTWGHARQ